MNNSKLVKALSSLSTSELKEYHSFVNTLYADHETPLQILQEIIEIDVNKDADTLNMSYLLDKHQHLSRKRISNEATKLLRWLEEYLLWQKLKEPKHKAARYLLLSEVFSERQEYSLLQKNINAFLKHQKTTRHHLNHGLWGYQNDFQRYYTITNKTKAESHHLLQQQIKNLDIYYLVNRLKAGCEERSRGAILQEEADHVDTIVQNIQSIAAAYPAEDFQLYHYYLAAYTLISTPKEKNYQAFYQQVLDSPFLLQKDLSAGLFYLINYNLRYIRRTDPQLGLQRSWQLFQIGSDKGWLTYNGYITESTLHNAIHIACGLGQVQQAQAFLNKNLSLLYIKQQPLAKLIAQARIDFENKEYQKVVHELKQLDFADNYHTIQAKVTQMRSYFELSTKTDDFYYDSLLNKLKNSFSTWLSRNEDFAKPILKSYQNFMTILTQLKNRNWSKEKLQRHLEQMTEVACRDWLNAKIKDYSPR